MAAVLRLLLLSVTTSLGIHGAQIPTTESTALAMPEVRVTCRSEHMTITVDSPTGLFDGMIYPRGLGRNSSCMTLYSHAVGTVSYNLPLSACNTMSSNMLNTITYFKHKYTQVHTSYTFLRDNNVPSELDISGRISFPDALMSFRLSNVLSTFKTCLKIHGNSPEPKRIILKDDGTIEYYNTIVVQPHRKLVTSQGKGFHVRCKYTTRDKLITNDINVNMMLEPTMLLGTAPMPGCTMVIYQGDHVAQNVKIGETLTLMVSIDKQDVYAMRLSHCSVTDATNSASQPLIDDYGCAVDPEIMGPFKYGKDGNSAEVDFQAHKFPYTDSVYYHCNVHLCLKVDDGCPPLPDCSSNSARKKRQADEGSPATIEVYSGLYVNEANDLARPDQFDLVARERALENPNNICISQRNFAIGIAIAGLVLMLMVIAAFVILLARRRTKKDVSSGSSIYSGPYTNTAYSHSS